MLPQDDNSYSMSPVTLEDQILLYFEQADGCTAEFVSPPPLACKQANNVYGFLSLHLLTGAIVLVFLSVLVGMVMTTLFPPAHH